MQFLGLAKSMGLGGKRRTPYHPFSKGHFERVNAAGGTIPDKSFVDRSIRHAVTHGYYEHIELMASPDFGYTLEGGSSDVDVLFDFGPKQNDLDEGGVRPSLVTSGGRTLLNWDKAQDLRSGWDKGDVYADQPFWTFCVVKHSNDGLRRLATETPGRSPWRLEFRNDGYLRFETNATFITGTQAGAFVNTLGVGAALANGSDSEIWTNGQLMASGNAGTGPLDGLRLGRSTGATSTWVGYCGLFSVLSSNISSSVRDAIHDFLIGEYSI